MILEEGFAWNGQTFGSLSQIWDRLSVTKLTPLRHLGLNWVDYPIIEMGEQLGLIVVAMNLEEPRVNLEGVEHTRFLLRGDDDRLHREHRAIRHNGLQLLQNAFGVGDVGDHESRHARKQGNGIARIWLLGFLKSKTTGA